MSAEGWYVDPYGLHDARWFSDGNPTALVRDRGVESRDAPPSAPYTGQLEPIVAPASAGPDDLRRADNSDGELEAAAVMDAISEVFAESSGLD